MKIKSNLCFTALAGMLTLLTNSANATSVYDNNISAMNINALSDKFMSYTDYGETMFDMFSNERVYGTMRRVDEYGDDGSTVPTFKFSGTKDLKRDSFIKDVWLNADYLNANDTHYQDDVSSHSKISLTTIGATIKSTELQYGAISFGGFASYIHSKLSGTQSDGAAMGMFSHYIYKNFGAHTLINIGSLNSHTNNPWFNIATDAYANLKIDDTFYIKPSLYIGYTWVSSDDMYISGNKITSRDYNFFNIAPSLKFIKQISDNWYGALSGKYVAHFGGDNDIRDNGVVIDGIKLRDHTDVGVDVEYNFNHLVLGGKLHRQLDGLNSWDFNLNAKYVF